MEMRACVCVFAHVRVYTCDTQKVIICCKHECSAHGDSHSRMSNKFDSKIAKKNLKERKMTVRGILIHLVLWIFRILGDTFDPFALAGPFKFARDFCVCTRDFGISHPDCHCSTV